jgi:hypothetical protein
MVSGKRRISKIERYLKYSNELYFVANSANCNMHSFRQNCNTYLPIKCATKYNLTKAVIYSAISNKIHPLAPAQASIEHFIFYCCLF